MARHIVFIFIFLLYLLVYKTIILCFRSFSRIFFSFFFIIFILITVNEPRYNHFIVINNVSNVAWFFTSFPYSVEYIFVFILLSIDFNFNNLTEDNIHKIFNDMAIIIKYYEESQFKLMAINVDYRDYYKYKKPFMIEKLVSDRIKKSYNLMFSICSFLNDIEIFSFLTLISYFVHERNNYKLHYSGEIIITKK